MVSLGQGVPSELHLFEKPILQPCILEEYDEPFDPINTLQDGAPITFYISPVTELYRDLNNSMLMIKCRIQTASGSSVSTENIVAPINLCLHAMFSQVELEIKEKLITDPNNLYPWRAYLETLLNYSSDVLKNRHIMEGWEKDTVKQLAISNPAGDNLGLKSRSNKFNKSALVTLIGRLHLDLFHQEKLIPGNVPLRFRLIPSTNAFLLNTAAPSGSNTQVEYKMHIEQARLFIKTKRIAPPILKAHREMLNSNHNFAIHFTRVNLKKFTIPANSSTATFNALYQGPIPDRVVVCFVRDDAISGSYQLNPFHLENLSINYISMIVNGEAIHKVPLRPDFKNDDYIREFMATLSDLNFDTGQNILDLTPSEWANGYTFFVFKIATGLVSTNIHTLARTGVVNLEIKFGEPTPRNVSMICLAQQPASIEIDKFDNVILA